MLVERNQTQKSTYHKVSFLFHIMYKILDNVNQTIGTESRSVRCLMTGCGDAGAGTGWRHSNGTQEGWQRYDMSLILTVLMVSGLSTCVKTYQMYILSICHLLHVNYSS